MAKIKPKKYQIIEIKKNKSLADVKLKIDLSLIPDKLFLRNTEHDRIFVLVEKDTYCYGGHICLNISTEERKEKLGMESIKVAEFTFANVYSDVSETAFEDVFSMTEAYLKQIMIKGILKMSKKEATVAAQKAAKRLLFEDNNNYLEKLIN